MVKKLESVIPIITTPCTKNGTLDLPSLRNEVSWCIDKGVKGFFLGYCSELFAYDHRDRNKIIETVVDEANGKVSVAAGSFATNTNEAIQYSRDAENLGADAIFMFGPYRSIGQSDNSVDIVEHYRRIDDEVDIPICGYNTALGSPGVMTPEKVFEILDACPGIKYMKTGEPTVQLFLQSIELGLGDRIDVILGKSEMNFRFLKAYPDAVGMSACIASVLPEEHVEMWEVFKKGDVDEARRIWIRRILPFVDLMSSGGVVNIRKEALFQMGVIESSAPVKPYKTAVIDDFHRRELNKVLRYLGKTVKQQL